MEKLLGKDKVVDIGLVRPNTWNPKDSIEENEVVRKMYEQIRDEIEKKGLFEAITVREVDGGYEILDGYHRWRACKELGYERLRVNNLGVIDDKLARAITVIKEQKKVPVSELGVADIVGWFKDEGVDDDEVQDLLGYDERTFKSYSSLFSFDLGDLDEKDREIKSRSYSKEVTCPSCGHKFNT